MITYCTLRFQQFGDVETPKKTRLCFDGSFRGLEHVGEEKTAFQPSTFGSCDFSACPPARWGSCRPARKNRP